MSSMSNLKEATRLLPGWVPPFFLSCLVVGLYVVALFTYNDRPSELVETATTAAIVLSTVIAFGFLVAAIVKSEQGSLGKSMSDGFSRGLTSFGQPRRVVWQSSLVQQGSIELSWTTSGTASLPFWLSPFSGWRTGQHPTSRRQYPKPIRFLACRTRLHSLPILRRPQLNGRHFK